VAFWIKMKIFLRSWPLLNVESI